jgi:ketosteroid isomerase-like protein
MAKDTILEFVKQINNHNSKEIAKLLSDDHCFVDAYGQGMTGKAEMEKAWDLYFAWFPDYVISISEIIIGKHCVAMFGFASGTYKGSKNETNSSYWRLPAAWKVIVEDDKIKHWQVYCDTKIPSDIMERNNTPQPVNQNNPPKPKEHSQFYK